MSKGSRFTLALSGLVFVVFAANMPSDWYFELSLPAGTSSFPVTGITLFRLAFVIQGSLLLLLGATGWQYRVISSQHRLRPEPSPLLPSARGCIVAIAAITALALLLRMLGVSQSFWIDEVTTLGYAGSDLVEMLTVYQSPNNHLLNSMLIKVSIGMLGESELSARLPAVMFGTATIPVLYWVIRRPLGAWPAVAVCLLLAVSYHHIFFSQNARGYSAYLFFSLLATGLFLKGLERDQARIWAAYIFVMLLNFVSLMNAAFVFLAHVTVGLFALFQLRQAGANIWPSARRLAAVFALLGLLVFQFYAIEIPQIYTVLNTLYSKPATGFSPFSMEFAQELLRGISAGFAAGAAIAALPFMVLALAGFFSLFKRDVLLTLLLLFPGVITALYLLAKGLTVSPRFFLFELILALICAVCAIMTAANCLGTAAGLNDRVINKVSVVSVLLLAVLSLAALATYYAVPKQPYREAVEFVEGTMGGNSKVIVVFTAGSGIAYYHGKRNPANEYTYVRSTDAFFAQLQEAENRPLVVITTFHRALGIKRPEILAELKANWVNKKTFPATVGDGNIYVWVRE